MGKWNMHYYAFLCKTGPRVNYNVGLLYVRSCNVEKNNDDMMVRSFADGWQYGMVYLYHVNSTMPKQWRIKSIVNINTTRASMLISFAHSAVCSLSSLATLLYYCRCPKISIIFIYFAINTRLSSAAGAWVCSYRYISEYLYFRHHEPDLCCGGGSRSRSLAAPG